MNNKLIHQLLGVFYASLADKEKLNWRNNLCSHLYLLFVRVRWVKREKMKGRREKMIMKVSYFFTFGDFIHMGKTVGPVIR